jgi:hypothetical protein
MKILYKEYTYTSSVKGEVIIVKGTVYAKDKKDAIFQAQKETSLSGYIPNEVTIKFMQISKPYLVLCRDTYQLKFI